MILCRKHNNNKRDKDLDELPVDWKQKIEFHANAFKDYWKEIEIKGDLQVW